MEDPASRLFREDQETGEELTPEYDVPLNPSIIYTPPGTVPHFWSSAFQERYNRMVPLIAQKHRNVLYGKVGGSVTPAGTNERYTKVCSSQSYHTLVLLILCYLASVDESIFS